MSKLSKFIALILTLAVTLTAGIFIHRFRSYAVEEHCVKKAE
jgi:hypothetical protein